MAKVKYDVTGVEVGARGELPKPGVYTAKIVEATRRTGDKNDIAIKLEIQDKAHKGFPLWDYVQLSEAAAFRLAALIQALGLKEKGTLDTAKIVGETVQVRTKIQSSEEFGDQVRIAFFLADGGEGDEDDEDLDDENEEGEEPEEEEEEEEEAEEDDDEVDLDELDRKGLKAHIKELGLEVKVLKSDSDDDVREKIKEAQGGEEEPEEEEGDDDEDGDDYDEWSQKELLDEIKERGITFKKGQLKGDKLKKKAVAALRKDDENDEDPFED